jgi:hypothetical protein
MTMTLPTLTLPTPNPRVLAFLAEHPVRDPDTADGRSLYLQRLGLVVIPHERRDAGWVCTAAGAALDRRTPVGAFLIGDVEIAAAAAVRDVFCPITDLYPAEVRTAWAARVWDRWPGGRTVQVAQALLEVADRDTLTIETDADTRAVIARRAGIPHPRGLDRPIKNLAAAGLLHLPDPIEQRYQLRLPGAAA